MSYSAYLETQVLSASPLELVALMYRAAIGHLESARVHLATGDIAARSGDVSRAMAIINELAQSIDPSPNPQFAKQLADLYAYILTRIQAGNFQQSDQPFAEAIHLLTTLLDGWQQIGSPTQPSHSIQPFHSDQPSHGESLTSDDYQPVQFSF
jgi:flagellar protein FliS